MALTTHLLVGAAIGSQVHSLAAIFILGLISHFVLDRLPHWDYAGNLDQEIKRHLPKFILKTSVDFLLGSLFIYLNFKNSPVQTYVLWGAFSSILPDGLLMLEHLLKLYFHRRFWPLEKVARLHSRNHNRNNSFNFLNFTCQLLITVTAALILLII